VTRQSAIVSIESPEFFIFECTKVGRRRSLNSIALTVFAAAANLETRAGEVTFRKEYIMRVEIYYLSGTGNSLHVAKELQKRITATKLIPIVGLLPHKRIQIEASTIGLIFPVQALGIPVVIRRFLRRARMEKGAYVFAVATREGTVFHGFRQINGLLRRNRQKLSSQFLLTMPTSDPRAKGYRPPTETTIVDMEQGIEKKLDVIAQTIRTKRLLLENGSESPIKTPYGKVRNYVLERLVLLAHRTSEHIGGVNYFYADAKCTGCGICSTVCLSSKIVMDEKRSPAWQRGVLCYMCFACVNHCPKESVQIRSIWAVQSHTTENGRYSHPYATAKEIAAQKVRQ